MQPGDILRQRKIRTYGAQDCRNYFEFTPDLEKSKDTQRVFVTMLLGAEMMKLCDKPDGTGPRFEPLDEMRALNALGYWSEEQLVEALGNKEARKLIKKLRPFVGSKERRDGAQSNVPRKFGAQEVRDDSSRDGRVGRRRKR